MRISLCNEVIAELPFARQCEVAAALGYDGLEIAPYTLGDDPTRLTAEEIATLRRAHHWLILHGRYVCTARSPHCEKCLINDICKWPGKSV